MAVTFAQVAAGETNVVRRGALETSVKVSNLWDRIYWEMINGNAYSYDQGSTLPGTGFRTVNEAYVESTGVINQGVEKLVILGGDADVDKFLTSTFSSTVGDLMADQVAMKLKSAQSTYVDTFFNGDVETRNAKEFDGLRKRLVGDQVIDPKSELDDKNSSFFNDMDSLFSLVEEGPNVVYAPTQIIAALKGAARNVAGAEYMINEINNKNEWTWNGVPFVDPGKHWSGRDILPYSNSDGGDVYAVHFADSWSEPGVMGITNNGLNATFLGELQEKPAYRTRIDFYCGLVAQGGRAAARLRNVKIAGA